MSGQFGIEPIAIVVLAVAMVFYAGPFFAATRVSNWAEWKSAAKAPAFLFIVMVLILLAGTTSGAGMILLMIGLFFFPVLLPLPVAFTGMVFGRAGRALSLAYGPLNGRWSSRAIALIAFLAPMIIALTIDAYMDWDLVRRTS